MKKILIFLVIFFEVFIIINSKEIVKEFTLTINLFLYSLMPMMFFQIFFSNIIINTNLYKIIPMKICRFFNLNQYDFSIVLISIFSGYPNNTKLLKDSENEYLNYSTSFINPLFLFGTVGHIYLNNIKLITIIYISHVLSNFVMLFILKNKYNGVNKYDNKIVHLYSDSLKTTIDSLLLIFSNLLFISLLITLIKVSFNLNSIIKSIIIGIIEFSRGIYEISYLNINLYLKGLLILLVVSFSSLSIHFQSISLNYKIKYIKFLLFRILNVLISIIIYFVILFIYTNV